MNLQGYAWKKCHVRGGYPNGLVQAGIDDDGSPIFVGRALYSGDILPAKVIPMKQAAYVCYNGGEHFVEDVEVLRNVHYVWKFSANGDLPVGAMHVGQTSDGEPLFMGRARHEGTLTPGKVHTSHGCLYIPFNGQELAIKEYEVLCIEANQD